MSPVRLSRAEAEQQCHEARVRLSALVHEQVSREYGRRPTGVWERFSDQQLADEIIDACQELRLHADEGEYLVSGLRILSEKAHTGQRNYGVDYRADPAALRADMIQTAWLLSKPGRSAWRRRRLWRTRELAGVVHFQTRKTAVGILWAVVLLYAVPMGLYVTLAVVTGLEPDWPKRVAGPAQGLLVPLALLMVAYLHALVRQALAVQYCEIHPDGAIWLVRRGRRIPFDVHAYRHVQLKIWVWGGSNFAATISRKVPGMLLMRRDARWTFFSALSTHIVPRVNDERVIVFMQGWRMADGTPIAPDAMAELFRQACVRAGRPPQEQIAGRTSYGWELRG